MKHTLLCIISCLCLLSLNPVTHAQNTDNTGVAVMHRFTVEAWPDYETGLYGRPVWSPNSSLVALPFNAIEHRNNPEHISWQIYDAETGAFLFSVRQFITWYADNTRLLTGSHRDGSARVKDARTGTTLFALPWHTAKFIDDPIQDRIISLDETNTLHIYDANTTDSDTADVLLSLDNVADLPVYLPDANRLIFTRTDTGVEIYDITTLDRVHHLANTPDTAYRLVRPDRTGYSFFDWLPDTQQITVRAKPQPESAVSPLHIWQPGHGLSESRYNVTDMHWLTDTRLALVVDFNRVQILNTDTDTIKQSFIPTERTPLTLLDWQDPYLIFRSGDIRRSVFHIGIYDTARNELIYHNFIDFFQHWLEDNTLVILEAGRGLKRINLADGQIRQSYEFDNNNLPWPSVSPNQQWAATGLRQPTQDGIFPVQLYRLNPPELAAHLERHTQEAKHNVTWSPDGQLFISSDPSAYIIWQLMENTVG